jgi:hypothetical protein
VVVLVNEAVKHQSFANAVLPGVRFCVAPSGQMPATGSKHDAGEFVIENAGVRDNAGATVDGELVGGDLLSRLSRSHDVCPFAEGQLWLGLGGW